MDFAQAVAYLDQHTNLEANAGWVHGLSLDRMTGLVGVLGDPQHAAPVIHVTGTNGKGSTVRMIAALLGAHGLTVGSYGSPHVESITERIQRNGEPISEEDFGSIVGELAALEALFPATPSYFDLLTAAAFSWFAREAVDVVVLEVGVLGRYDSTNVADAAVAVITNVGRDHTDGEGDWRRAIAEEKAGIITPDAVVVVGETDPDLVEVFVAEGGAAHWVRDRDFGVRSSVLGVGGRQCDLYTPSGALDELFVPLHGAHQIDNAALAVAAVEAFFGRPLDHDVAAAGLASVDMPGRFEVVQRAPLIVVDAAHNQDGAAVTVETMDEEFRVEGDRHVVVGLLSRSDAADVVGVLLEVGPSTVTCTTPESPRAVPADELAAMVRSAAPDSVLVLSEPDPSLAVEGAVDRLQDGEALLITGSTYLAGTARSTLRRLGILG